jgi:hypothetical protein
MKIWEERNLANVYFSMCRRISATKLRQINSKFHSYWKLVQSSSYTCHKHEWCLQLIFHWQYAGPVNPNTYDSFDIMLLSSWQQLLLYTATAYWMVNMRSCLSIKHIALCKTNKIKTQCSANSYPGTLRQLDELFVFSWHYINCCINLAPTSEDDHVGWIWYNWGWRGCDLLQDTILMSLGGD